MPNFTIIESSVHEDIASNLSKIARYGAHFTCGTYMYEKDIILPITLTGFKYISSIEPNLPFVIAINSDKSMKAIGKNGFEPQLTRAYKVAGPLAEHFPQRKIIIIFFDETAPTELFHTLQKHGLTITHHKWGYGTNPSEPKIEGAECFKLVFGLPTPADLKPICYYDTPTASSTQNIKVVDLRDILIGADRRLLFDVPVKLQQPVFLSWREAVRYIQVERNRAISDRNYAGEISCQEQLDRLGGLVPTSSERLINKIT